MIRAWVYFELIKGAGWFKNILSGNAPFLEVALADNDNFELNLGKPKDECVNKITAPGNWKSEKNFLYQSCHNSLNGLTNFLRTLQVKQRNSDLLDGLMDFNCHTPISSSQSSGFDLMKSRMS